MPRTAFNRFLFSICYFLAFILAYIPTISYAGDTKALNELNSLLSKISSLQANFTQTTKIKTTRIPIKAGQTLRSSQLGQNFSGLMQVKRPGNFRWEVSKPMNQIITSNGKVVWIYDPDLAQATKQTLDAQMNNTPALLLSGNIADIARAFNVSQPNASIANFVLTPRLTDGVFETLTILFDKNKPRRMVLVDALGQETTINFEHVKLNPHLSNDRFKFTPPTGVDVIQQ